MLRPDLLLLCFGYVLSQFFRAFLAVLSPVLSEDLGTTPEDLAFASGIWFLVFAAMQIPVGEALDRIGPRRTAAALLLIGGGGGALLFAFAQSPTHVTLAMALIGVGCSPVLMASYYIFARSFPAAQFATLAALMLGVGTTGNLIASYPMALAAETIGWRGSLVGLAILSSLTAIGLGIIIRDPPKVDHAQKGSVLDLLRMPALWLIFPMMLVNYFPAAGIRGAWIGPYLQDVFEMDTTGIGKASLVMGIAMIVGTLIYGPMDRVFGTRKWVVFIGNTAGATACVLLAMFGQSSAALSIALMAAIGFFCASFPLILAHGRSFFPEHLMGRGVTLMNLFGIGGVGLMQVTSGPVFASLADTGRADAYSTLFLAFGLIVFVALALYFFSREQKN
ncbi:MFS transporter [Shimia biformata]|uniref:MFS transporter n=1 Tax=Shimia biformata TaxID=1294299 RepID=UPI0019529654|nr:MFS transporter [Shimia biformata]